MLVMVRGGGGGGGGREGKEKEQKKGIDAVKGLYCRREILLTEKEKKKTQCMRQ